MSLKAKVEAIIYATEEPVTLDQLASLLRDEVLTELRSGGECSFRAAMKSFRTGRHRLRIDELEEDSAFDDIPVPSALPLRTFPRRFPRLRPSAKKTRKLRPRKNSGPSSHGSVASLTSLPAEYSSSDRGMEIRQIAGGYRMTTKPEHHDVVVNFAKSLKPPVRLSLQALETLAVIAYKQPVTVPEISEIRGVDTSGVIATLLDRKLVTTAGRKQVIGRPILYRTTKEFLLRFGLNDVSELPSMEEFEKLGDPQADLFAAADKENPESSAEHPPEVSEADESEPVTEAVPENSDCQRLLSATPRCRPTAPTPPRPTPQVRRRSRSCMPAERLQKIIAAAGIASRRKAEELITGGLVSVNGQIVTELGSKAESEQRPHQSQWQIAEGTGTSGLPAAQQTERLRDHGH